MVTLGDQARECIERGFLIAIETDRGANRSRAHRLFAPERTADLLVGTGTELRIDDVWDSVQQVSKLFSGLRGVGPNGVERLISQGKRSPRGIAHFRSVRGG